MTFKFGRGENDGNIHMSRTLGASRVIGWYSDTKKLSFAFIPRRTEGHLFGIKGPLPLRGNTRVCRRYYTRLSIRNVYHPVLRVLVVDPRGEKYPERVATRQNTFICDVETRGDRWSSSIRASRCLTSVKSSGRAMKAHPLHASYRGDERKIGNERLEQRRKVTRDAFNTLVTDGSRDQN